MPVLRGYLRVGGEDPWSWAALRAWAAQGSVQDAHILPDSSLCPVWSWFPHKGGWGSALPFTFPTHVCPGAT